MSEIPSPQRHFLPADQALLPALADYLLNLGDELKHTLVIVPTAHSGRRLRRFLPQVAEHPILAPIVQTPESAFRPAPDSPAAAKLLWWAAWSEVLKVAAPETLSAIFPEIDELERDAHWGLSTARQFAQLKDELAEIDAGFAHAAKFSEEPERWQALETLDQQVIQRLQQWGAYCPAESKRFAAVHWRPPVTCRRIVLAAVPDAVPLSLRAWQNALGELPVDVLIHADAAIADHFDDWGRPLAEPWKEAKIIFPGKDSDWIQVAAGPHETARRCVESCAELDNHEVALGMVDSAFGPAAAEAFAEAGWPSYDPDGQRLSSTGVWSVLRTLRQLIASPDAFSEVPSLIKAPESSALLLLRSPLNCAREIDKLCNFALPTSLAAALRSAELSAFDPDLLAALQELESLLRQAQPGKAVEWLGQIFDRLEQAPSFPEELKSSFTDALDALAQLSRHNPNLPVTDAMDLLLAQVESTRLKNERAGTAIDQLGWLELAYEQAPHLRLIGLHEGLVPDQPSDNGFLTESLRSKLGLRGRAQREARDAYLLSSFIQARRDQGTVMTFIAQADAAGNSRQASRLLLRCPLSELSQRVQHCFNEELDDIQVVPAYSRAAWHLKLPEGPLVFKPEQDWCLSPSLLKSYLRCPLRFYLERELKFRREEFDKNELDAMDFGNVIHDVMEAYGRDPQWRELSSVEEIEIALEDLLEQRFNQRYGSSHTLALTIQRESLSRRLKRFAQDQAQSYLEGWRIEEVEFDISPDGANSWEFDSQPVKMRIDRIDRCIHSGRRRLIDYKSGKAKLPEEAHLETIKASELEKFIFADPAPPKGRSRSPRRWMDLQLPLYAEFARQKWGELPEIGYANLPSVASESGFTLWSDYEGLHENAMQWATEALQGIRNGFFEERPFESEWDPFNAIAPDSLNAAFDLNPSL